MKYIDAEKLMIGIKQRIKELDNDKCLSTDSKTSRIAELHFIDRFIDSLQQEQPDVDLERVVMVDNIIMNMIGEGFNDGYKTRPFYEEVVRRIIINDILSRYKQG